MRAAALLQSILMVSSVLLVSGVVFAEDSETVISGNVTWNGDETIEGTIRIVDGGHLTIEDAEIEMVSGSSIHVDDGGKLTLDRSSLIAQTPPTAIASMGYWDEQNISKFKVPGEGISGSFEVEMSTIVGDSYFGDTAHIGAEWITLNGSSHTFYFEDGTGDVWIGLTGYSTSSSYVASITISTEAGGETTILGSELETMNMMGAGEPGFQIFVDGTMNTYSSTILGAQMFVEGGVGSSSSGSWAGVTAINAEFDRVGPVMVGNTGTFDISGMSSFSMSLDDHDIRAGPDSLIYWGPGASGSGGLIDRWERRLADQTLELDAKYVVLRLSGIGPQESTQEVFSDENGIAYVNGGNERVIEIGWADGTVWSESATIEVVSYETGWNPASSEIGNYGGGVASLDWSESIVLDSGIPYVEWESLTIREDSTSKAIGQSMPVVANLANRGTAAALLYFTCEVAETGLEADIGGYQQVRIDAGETVEVSFGWRHSQIGDASLSCRILTPTQLVEDDAFGGGSMTTLPATWTEPVEDDSLPMLPLLAAIIVAMAIAGSTMLRRASDAIVEDDEDSDYSRDEY